MTAKQFIVIAYDITDDKKRQKVAKLLETSGERCNFSVFECLLAESKIKILQKKIDQIINKKTDCVLFYYLCKSCIEKSEVMGRNQNRREEIVWV